MSNDGPGASDAVYGALSAFWRNGNLQRRLDMGAETYWAQKRARHGNPLLMRGEKFFSQNDEDGLTLEICRRLGLAGGTALEYGVGDGRENNSLVLLFAGWTVAWVGGEPLGFAVPAGCRNLAFERGWVTAATCATLGGAVLARLGQDLAAADVLSIDLDGNDIYVLDALFDAGARPALLIVEYNSKFPPPIRWQIRYDPAHVWDGSDYQGASLQSFVDLAERRGYRLVACNITGSNAFFVRESDAAAFSDVPRAPADLFVAADYNWFVERGHATSVRTIEAALRV